MADGLKQALQADLPDLERAAILMELGIARLRAGESLLASETYRDALKLCDPDSLEAYLEEDGFKAIHWGCKMTCSDL